MAEKESIKCEKKVARSEYEILTKDNLLYKPHNETLKFDILWDLHWQAGFIAIENNSFFADVKIFSKKFV